LEIEAGKSSDTGDEPVSSHDENTGELASSLEADDTSAPPPLPRAPEKEDRARSSQTEAKVVRRISSSIGIGLPRNKYRVFIGKGAIPPLNEIKQFVAPLADIDKVRIKIIEGDNESADKNLYVGEIGINNIKLREDGKAELELDFSLNASGILTVRLRDRIGNLEGVARFVPHQFRKAPIQDEPEISRLPIEELNKKISLLEEQMQALKGELEVRGEGKES
jgi:molecular chaperone DnaK (HSP70)